MRRREFIFLMGGGAVVWPYAVIAQDVERSRRIGVLVDEAWYTQSFAQRLAELGWKEGRNIRIDSERVSYLCGRREGQRRRTRCIEARYTQNQQWRLMLARNCDLCLLASASSRLFCSISHRNVGQRRAGRSARRA